MIADFFLKAALFKMGLIFSERFSAGGGGGGAAMKAVEGLENLNTGELIWR